MIRLETCDYHEFLRVSGIPPKMMQVTAIKTAVLSQHGVERLIRLLSLHELSLADWAIRIAAPHSDALNVIPQRLTISTVKNLKGYQGELHLHYVGTMQEWRKVQGSLLHAAYSV